MLQVQQAEAEAEPPASEALPTEVDRYKLLSDMLNRNTRWAEVADAKAGAVLFFVGATSRILIEPIIDSATQLYDAGLENLSAREALLHIAFVVVTILIVAAVFWTIYHAFVTLVPRVRRNANGRHGAMFFGDLARLGFDDWRARILGYTEHDVIEDLAGQVHAAGVIADTKHDHIRHAVSGVLAVLALAPILYVLSMAVT